MKLYGVPPTRATRPLWVLNALDIDCEIVPVDIPNGEHRGEEFMALNPFGKVPLLVDGDIRLAESAAIMFHLAETRGGGRLIPTAPAERAALHQWMFFLVTEIEPPLWRAALHSVIYPDAQRIPGEIACAERDGRRMLAPLEAHMADRRFLVGNDVTIADYNAAYTLDWAQSAGWLDASPHLRRFVEAMYDRPEAPPRLDEGFAYLKRGAFAPRRRAEVAVDTTLSAGAA